MKLVKDTTGRFSERPHYTTDELEAICNKPVIEFLQNRYGEKYTYPISTDDLLRIIERHADLDLYANLGDGIEGVTDFSLEKPEIKIAEHLSEESASNRFRATLAHELSHVIVHKSLFNDKKMQFTLDLIDESPLRSMTYRDSHAEENSLDWLEWQAWYATGAILIPKDDLIQRIQKYVLQTGITTPVDETSFEASELIARVSNKYQVSNVLATLRLKRLLILGKPDKDQGRLITL